jgi:DNA polymerase III sliding clamp (beta) subunit (PCNA family)
MIIKILDPVLFFTAYAAVAQKDVRYYLNGLFIEPDGNVVGTDGHVLIKTKCTNAKIKGWPAKDVIVQIIGKLPVPQKIDNVVLDTKNKTFTYKVINTSKTVTLKIELIDAKYIGYKRVLRKPVSKPASASFAFDVSLLSKIQKVYGCDAFKFNVGGEREPLLFVPPTMEFDNGTFTGLAMPWGKR